jgi:hypothetical protein
MQFFREAIRFFREWMGLFFSGLPAVLLIALVALALIQFVFGVPWDAKLSVSLK